MSTRFRRLRYRHSKARPAPSRSETGHATFAAVIYLTLGALLARFTERRRTRVYLVGLALSLTFLVGVSRLYLGVHYPTDVVAGWCVGLVWALSCWLVARYLQYRGRIERAIPTSQAGGAIGVLDRYLH